MQEVRQNDRKINKEVQKIKDRTHEEFEPVCILNCLFELFGILRFDVLNLTNDGLLDRDCQTSVFHRIR